MSVNDIKIAKEMKIYSSYEKNIHKNIQININTKKNPSNKNVQKLYTEDIIKMQY